MHVAQIGFENTGLFVDISRARFNPTIDPDDPCHVQFPPEAGRAENECGLLRRHMYGTRRAAEGWQDEYSATLVAVSVHGDDFAATGPKRQLDWFQSMLSEHYAMTVGGRQGPGKEDDKEATALNMVIRWTPNGIEYEADLRQVKRLLDQIDLLGEGSKGQ